LSAKREISQSKKNGNNGTIERGRVVLITRPCFARCAGEGARAPSNKKGVLLKNREGRELPSTDGVKEERIGCQRLAAVLWAEAEEHDASFAYAYFD